MRSRGVVPITRPSTETSPQGRTATWSCPGSTATVDGGAVTAGSAAGAAVAVAGGTGRVSGPTPLTGRDGRTDTGGGVISEVTEGENAPAGAEGAGTVTARTAMVAGAIDAGGAAASVGAATGAGRGARLICVIT